MDNTIRDTYPLHLTPRQLALLLRICRHEEEHPHATAPERAELRAIIDALQDTINAAEAAIAAAGDPR